MTDQEVFRSSPLERPARSRSGNPEEIVTVVDLAAVLDR